MKNGSSLKASWSSVPPVPPSFGVPRFQGCSLARVNLDQYVQTHASARDWFMLLKQALDHEHTRGSEKRLSRNFLRRAGRVPHSLLARVRNERAVRGIPTTTNWLQQPRLAISTAATIFASTAYERYWSSAFHPQERASTPNGLRAVRPRCLPDSASAALLRRRPRSSGRHHRLVQKTEDFDAHLPHVGRIRASSALQSWPVAVPVPAT